MGNQVGNQEIEDVSSDHGKNRLVPLVNALKKSREANGWTVEEVAEKLRISASHLYALEDEQLDIASLDPFKRGYLRNYADLLGVDISTYAEILSDVKSPEAPIQPVSAEDPSIKPIFSMTTLKVTFSLVIILLIAFLVMINI